MFPMPRIQNTLRWKDVYKRQVMGSDATACAPALVLSGTGMHSFYIDTVEIKEVCSRADINDENYPSEWQNNACLLYTSRCV